MSKEKCQKLSIFSWCLYDWANSAFNTIIITFVFSVYFSRGIIGDETEGAALWSYALGISGFFVAILSPILGAFADHSGRRKHWLFIFSILCILPTAALFYGDPSQSEANILYVLILVGIANIAFEIAQVFYNAMLPHIAPSNMLGRVSGCAWGLGYFGGLIALALTLLGLVGIGGFEPFFDITGAESANVRASAILTALWFFIFMLPLFFFTQDEEKDPLNFWQAMKNGFLQLRQTIREVTTHKNLLQFLIASAIYRDGLVTLFAIGGVYAAGQFGMDFQQILIFAIGLNITAGLGALSFSFLDDYLGSKPTILMSLAALVVCGLAILFLDDMVWFMVLALILGIFVGPVQAASRTLAGRLAPQGMVTQTYGLYAFTGKSAAFLGPLAYGAATSFFDSQQAGMASIILFWLIGMALLLLVKER